MRRLGAFLTSIGAVALVLVLVPQAHAAGANFHVSCGFVDARMDDPIVHPGEPGASHMYLFFGNVSPNAFSTYASMRAAPTSCNFAANTSGYWAPALVAPNGSMVTPLRMSAYYWARTQVIAPAADLRMIAGGDTHNLKVAGYTCGEGTPTSSVPLNCGTQLLKGVIVFPSCWDGVHTDSPDHRSHMAYPTGKGCPTGLPVRIPRLILHITYGLHDGTGYGLMSDNANLSNGMTLHADFWNTWDQTVLEQEVTSCLNAGLICDLGA